MTASAMKAPQFFMSDTETKFMRRALQLAALGRYDAHPNPMVGAVIVHDGRIIGEGWHRLCGQAHAEVNAVASVKDKSLLKNSTLYVTLEPCSHYGKTPPCAELIIRCAIPRVVVASVDPFEKVAGRGIALLREAGVEVVVGVLDDEARRLNRRFFTAHTLRRPYVTLKWAQSIDGWLDRKRNANEKAAAFSTPLSAIAVHQLRAEHDAVLTTAATVMADNPRLNVRHWATSRQPQRIVIDRRAVLNSDANSIISSEYDIFAKSDLPTILFANSNNLGEKVIHVPTDENEPFENILRHLYSKGITSVLIEAGGRFLQAVLDAGLWDEIRVEIAPFSLGNQGNIPSPTLPSNITLLDTEHIGKNNINRYVRAGH